jgi:hypothetical protein
MADATRTTGSALIALVLAIVYPGAVVHAEPPIQKGWVPTAAAIAAFEARLKLPNGAQPLSEYERYYAGTWIGGRKMIEGVLETAYRRHKRGKVHIVPEDQLPGIMDGGCYIITVLFDVTTNRTAQVSCNGLA